MGTGTGVFSFLNRRTIRAPVNVHDKTTVVSIYPKDITERKHTIQPSVYHIPRGTVKEPGILVVGTASWWKEMEDGQPLLEIPQNSLIVAKSLCEDFCQGMLGCNMADAMPGLFWVEGEHSKEDITIKYNERLMAAEERQKNWYRVLVQMADSLWATSNGNPRIIGEFMKIGAKYLGLEDKPWIKDYQAVSMVRCEGCGSLRDPNYPICQTCKMIDPKHPKAKELKFAV